MCLWACFSLWAQLSSTQTNDSTDATRAAKTQFLHKLQVVVSLLVGELGVLKQALSLEGLGKGWCGL